MHANVMILANEIATASTVSKATKATASTSLMTGKGSKYQTQQRLLLQKL